MSFCSNLFVNFKHFIHLLSCFSTITGTRIGTVIGLPLAGVLCASDLWGGWPSVFYIYGMYIYTPVCIWNWLIMVIDRMESTNWSLIIGVINKIGQLQNRRQICSSHKVLLSINHNYDKMWDNSVRSTWHILTM